MDLDMVLVATRSQALRGRAWVSTMVEYATSSARSSMDLDQQPGVSTYQRGAIAISARWSMHLDILHLAGDDSLQALRDGACVPICDDVYGHNLCETEHASRHELGGDVPRRRRITTFARRSLRLDERPPSHHLYEMEHASRRSIVVA